MSNISLFLGIEALNAARISLDTVGHNLANANTPGYSRQRVLLATAPAVRIGNRILLLSPHPGQVKAELNSDGTDPEDPATSERLSERIHRMLFADKESVEEPPIHV